MKTKRDTVIRIGPTGREFEKSLGPVSLTVECGRFCMTDWLTVDEAMDLSRSLVGAVHDFEERQDAAMDDARAAAPDFHVEDDGGAEDERAAA